MKTKGGTGAAEKLRVPTEPGPRQTGPAALPKPEPFKLGSGAKPMLRQRAAERASDHNGESDSSAPLKRWLRALAHPSPTSGQSAAISRESAAGASGEVVAETSVDGVRYVVVRCDLPTPGTQQLSPRGQEIARMVAKGLPNKTIAAVLDQLVDRLHSSFGGCLRSSVSPPALRWSRGCSSTAARGPLRAPPPSAPFPLTRPQVDLAFEGDAGPNLTKRWRPTSRV